MLRNVGGIERGIRLVVGGFMVVGAMLLDVPSWSTTALGVGGIIVILTGAVGHCPVWSIFGINTDRDNSKP